MADSTNFPGQSKPYQGDRKPSAAEHREGKTAKMIEEQTAKLPSDAFLWTAGAIMVGSFLLQVAGRKETSNFIGQWAPTLLIMGLYNKLVKVAGSDRLENQGYDTGAAKKQSEAFATSR